MFFYISLIYLLTLFHVALFHTLPFIYSLFSFTQPTFLTLSKRTYIAGFFCLSFFDYASVFAENLVCIRERLYGKISFLIVIDCLIKALILKNISIYKMFKVQPYS